ncbi:MAG TPA: L,D-transpeptidase family protein [Chitinophagaceae bacterium]|nr:L,D-transpeptidase family protein [Chitinophagaceae bacterium]
MKTYSIASILFTVGIALFIACNNGNIGIAERDTSVTILTSFNNLFLDSAAIRNFLSKNVQYKADAEQIFSFYKKRNYEYAWFDSGGLGEQASNFMNLLDNTIGTLQDSSLYSKELNEAYNSFTSSNNVKHRLGEAMNTELMLTGQFFNYAAKIYKGTDSSITDLGWFIPRKKINLTQILDSVVAVKNKSADEFAPLNEEYKKLAAFVPVYIKLQKSFTWDSIEKPEKTLHLKETSPIISKVRNRLFILGDLPVNDSSAVFDSALYKGVVAFQKRNGLGSDGAIGNKMIDAINVTPAQRLQQILVNLERLRWMPQHFDSNYIFVNIPEYKMYVYEDAELKFPMNVIVGKTATGTTIFSGKLKYIVFSPSWKVPVSIIKNEILPGIKKNPNYLEKHHMEKTGGSDSMPVIVQKPGAFNSLGHIKFLFPNSYDIYFHDTPERSLFTASTRNFSHGCIRLGEPKKLASFLLKNDTSWTSKKIDSCMHLEKEMYVTLKKTTPVYIGYFTSWVDSSGILNFRPDIYGHDKKLAEKLFSK